MRKCPECGYKSLTEERVRDEKGKDRGSYTTCQKCAYVDMHNLDKDIRPTKKIKKKFTSWKKWF